MYFNAGQLWACLCGVRDARWPCVYGRSLMRLFNLFLRRAGVRPTAMPVRKPLSRLTIMCPRADLAQLRKQIYADFGAAGLSVAGMQIDHGKHADLATACVTVNCPPELRSVLMDRARHLRSNPSVRGLQWGDHRHIALN